MEEDRFTMKYVVVSHKHKKIAAEGYCVIVMYNYNEGKKTLSLRRSGRRSFPGIGSARKNE
jgi:acyl-CoA thioesterase FadM